MPIPIVTWMFHSHQLLLSKLFLFASLFASIIIIFSIQQQSLPFCPFILDTLLFTPNEGTHTWIYWPENIFSISRLHCSNLENKQTVLWRTTVNKQNKTSSSSTTTTTAWPNHNRHNIVYQSSSQPVCFVSNIWYITSESHTIKQLFSMFIITLVITNSIRA